MADAHWLAAQQVVDGSVVRVQFHPSYVLIGVPA
jgi:molybdate transport system regulatory protein